MRVLLHTCCAPCLLYPAEVLTKEGIDFTVFWYNPNIHPYTEYQRRLDTLLHLLTTETIPAIIRNDYPIVSFLQEVCFNEHNRCAICYRIRLNMTAAVARSAGFSHISTTLLYSKYQKHNVIKELGEEIAGDYGLEFFYEDFREGWKRGIELSKDKGLYRQEYCGCIYSEVERYAGGLE